MLDIYMPAGMRLIMMSGHDLDETTLLESGQAGFDHCIDKAITLEGCDRLFRGDEGQLPHKNA